MHPVAWSVDVDNDRMMHHSINDGGCDDRIAQVLAQCLEVDVGCQDCKRGRSESAGQNRHEIEGAALLE
jgi:hypothetical protein